MSFQAGFVKAVCIETIFRDVALLAIYTKLAMACLKMLADLDISSTARVTSVKSEDLSDNCIIRIIFLLFYLKYAVG